jgi:hypothetical protein
VYYWDGISFAQDIEQGWLRPVALMHPNHLLYSPMGHRLWELLNSIGLDVRALTILQALNSVLAAIAVAVMFNVFLKTVHSRYVAACLALIFAFSATWWKFATDANSYIPSVFALTVCLWLLVPQRKAAPIVLGMVHAASMQLHQLAVLFYPAAVVGVWLQHRDHGSRARFQAVALYALTATGFTLLVYCAAFVAYYGDFDLSTFLTWITSHSSDASFSFSIHQNALVSVISHVKLFLGGQLRLVREHWDALTLMTITAACLVLVILVLQTCRRPLLSRVQREFSPMMHVGLIMVGVYAFFLFFWLPHNTFYRLFYLPAVLLVFGILFSGTPAPPPPPPRSAGRLALGVAAMALLNFSFYIYPQTHSAANPLLRIASEMREVWPPNTIVYWDVFSTDNQTIKYFNPQVEWKELWGRAWISQVEESIAKTRLTGSEIWFDSPALTKFREQDAEFRDWLDAHCVFEHRREFETDNSKLGFVQLVCRSTGAE